MHHAVGFCRQTKARELHWRPGEMVIKRKPHLAQDMESDKIKRYG
jgi:hypothetical protein